MDEQNETNEEQLPTQTAEEGVNMDIEASRQYISWIVKQHNDLKTIVEYVRKLHDESIEQLQGLEELYNHRLNTIGDLNNVITGLENDIKKLKEDKGYLQTAPHAPKDFSGTVDSYAPQPRGDSTTQVLPGPVVEESPQAKQQTLLEKARAALALRKKK